MNMKRNAEGRRWSGRVRNARELDELPGGVFWVFGLFLPMALVAGGLYCLNTDGFFLPIARGKGVVLAGDTAIGVGVVAFGAALFAHSSVLRRCFRSLRSAGLLGMFAGLLLAIAGIVIAAR